MLFLSTFKNLLSDLIASTLKKKQRFKYENPFSIHLYFIG